jgi:hypothetical protein
VVARYASSATGNIRICDLAHCNIVNNCANCGSLCFDTNYVIETKPRRVVTKLRIVSAYYFSQICCVIVPIEAIVIGRWSSYIAPNGYSNVVVRLYSRNDCLSILIVIKRIGIPTRTAFCVEFVCP